MGINFFGVWSDAPKAARLLLKTLYFNGKSMSNPINFNAKENQYYIWVSYWGIKIMKYFETPDDVLSYISAYPNRCMEIKKPINNET